MIDEEKKQRIRELREEEISVKEVANTLNVSESTVKRYSSDDYEKDNEKNKFVEKTLTDIFNYENYMEESVIDLIFNLKRIAKESGMEDLGDFIESIEILFTQYYKKTENIIKLFNFLLEISENLSVITDHIDVDVLISVIDNFVNREIAMENAETYIAESKAEADLLLAELKEMWNDCQERIENAKKEAMSEVESKSKTILKNSKEAYAEYKEKIDSAKKDLDSINTARNIARTVLIEELEKKEKIETENQELKSENRTLKILLEQANEEKTMMELIYEKVSGLFPQECVSILNEIKNEQL